MEKNNAVKQLIGIACAALALLPGSAVRADDAGNLLQNLVTKWAPGVVTVKISMKTAMSFGGQSQDQESKSDVPGVVVDSSGLVMISNAPFSPNRLMAMLGGG